MVIWITCIPRPNVKDNYDKMASTINSNYLHGLWHWQSLDKIRSIDLISADRSYFNWDESLFIFIRTFQRNVLCVIRLPWVTMETFFRVMHVGQRASGKRLTTVGHEPRFEFLFNLHIPINKESYNFNVQQAKFRWFWYFSYNFNIDIILIIQLYF